jgi:energy-coupling factor transporter ATP-binding protein EcfA2
MREQKDLAGHLVSLAATLESLDIGPGADALRAERDRLADTIRDFLIPRVIDPSTPVTVVVAGPTGSGKSTLVNSLAGIDVTRAGALRPTTRIPVVVASPPHDEGLDQLGGVRCQIVVADAPLLESLVLVDSPDIDSTEAGNRARAETLIDNADVIVFVTSATRYADDVPWQVLRRAMSRGTPVINVLNRVGSASSGALIDFKSRLAEAGLDADPVTVPEHHLSTGAQRIPSLAVKALQRRLGDVVAERDHLSGSIMRRVLSATMSQVIALTDSLATIRDDVDGLEAELSLDLVGRVSSLDLGGVGADLLERPPSGRNPVARWLWKRRSALDAGRLAEAEDTIVTRVTSLVSEDVRHWLADSRPMLAEHEIHPEPILSAVVSAVNSAARTWVTYVARIAEDHQRQPGSELATLVLVEAATAPGAWPAAEILFSADADVLVERARKELVGRLEVIYELTASLVVEELRERLGEFDESELRPAMGAVMSTFAPVHA